VVRVGRFGQIPSSTGHLAWVWMVRWGRVDGRRAASVEGGKDVAGESLWGRWSEGGTVEGWGVPDAEGTDPFWVGSAHRGNCPAWRCGSEGTVRRCREPVEPVTLAGRSHEIP
jgi:hypothetical protein